MSETLHTCPKCGRDNFTTRGLATHRCRPADETESPTPTAVAIPSRIAKAPVLITGTWDGARRWLTAAERMEQGKLFCQVMLGFELMALRTALSIKNGGDRKTAQARSDSQNGNVVWQDVLKEELGLSVSTAYRFIEMAETAKPRIKRLPELKEFDPTAQPIATLPENTQAALVAAVKKITDGSTQADFCRERGLAKLPPGAASTGRAKGDGGRPAAGSIEEQHASAVRHAQECLEYALKGHEMLREQFVLLTDAECQALEVACEKHLKAVRQWLRTPLAARNPAEIASLFA